MTKRCAMLAVALFATFSSVSAAAKKKGAGAMLLEKMNNFIATQGQTGLSPIAKAEVYEIRQILNMDISPALLQAAQDAQNRIDQLWEEVLECQVEVHTGLQINKEIWHETITLYENSTRCWYEDFLIIDEEKEVCKKYSELRTTLRLPDIPPADETDNALAYNYLKKMSEYFCSVEEEYEHTWEVCKKLKQNHTETYKFCEVITEEYEEKICGWDAELNETCTEYMECGNDTLHDYLEACDALTDLQEEWQAEMDAVKKIDCLWKTWNFSTDPCVVNITEVYECEQIPINYTNVTVVCQEPPEPATCPPPDLEEAQIDPALPCSDEFMNAAFGYLGLPQSEIESMKADCRECPHKRDDVVIIPR